MLFGQIQTETSNFIDFLLNMKEKIYMKWQPVRNKNYSSRDTYCYGDCPRFIESATLSIHLSGKQGSKSDLQPTFTPYITECSLLKEKNDKNTACMLSCPIFETYKKSYDY